MSSDSSGSSQSPTRVDCRNRGYRNSLATLPVFDECPDFFMMYRDRTMPWMFAGDLVKNKFPVCPPRRSPQKPPFMAILGTLRLFISAAWMVSLRGDTVTCGWVQRSGFQIGKL